MSLPNEMMKLAREMNPSTDARKRLQANRRGFTKGQALTLSRELEDVVQTGHGFRVGGKTFNFPYHANFGPIQKESLIRYTTTIGWTEREIVREGLKKSELPRWKSAGERIAKRSKKFKELKSPNRKLNGIIRAIFMDDGVKVARPVYEGVKAWIQEAESSNEKTLYFAKVTFTMKLSKVTGQKVRSVRIPKPINNPGVVFVNHHGGAYYLKSVDFDENTGKHSYSYEGLDINGRPKGSGWDSEGSGKPQYDSIDSWLKDVNRVNRLYDDLIDSIPALIQSVFETGKIKTTERSNGAVFDDAEGNNVFILIAENTGTMRTVGFRLYFGYNIREEKVELANEKLSSLKSIVLGILKNAAKQSSYPKAGERSQIDRDGLLEIARKHIPWFNLREESNYGMSWQTREHGDVGMEEPGDEDWSAAVGFRKEVVRTYGYDVEIEPVDEWVDVEVRA